MIYELRIYHMFPGMMEAIHNRFSNATLKIFEKHGMKVVDFWEDIQGKDKIYYVMEFKDMETRDKSFEDFRNDPEWIEVRRVSELNGPIVKEVESHFMQRVPYSPQSDK